MQQCPTMKTIRPGHLYELENFEKKDQQGQMLQFIEKVSGYDPTALVTVNDGTTNEEVLRVLIDRLRTLSLKFPCRENSIASTKLEEALMWLEKGTANRVKRGVEGKHLA